MSSTKPSRFQCTYGIGFASLHGAKDCRFIAIFRWLGLSYGMLYIQHTQYRGYNSLCYIVQITKDYSRRLLEQRCIRGKRVTSTNLNVQTHLKLGEGTRRFMIKKGNLDQIQCFVIEVTKDYSTSLHTAYCTMLWRHKGQSLTFTYIWNGGIDLNLHG